MKISKLFHWLYASVMFIPLMIAPIFALAVRSDNNFQPIEVEVNQQVQKINYKYESNEVNSLNDLHTGNIYNFNIQNNTIDAYFNSDSSILLKLLYLYEYDFTNYASDASLGEIMLAGLDLNNCYLNIDHDHLSIYLLSDKDLEVFLATIEIGTLSDYSFVLNCDIQLVDYSINRLGDNPFSYTEYNIIESISYEGEIITYNDTDVGSQLIYTLYNATDKYFNFNKFLGIGNLFDWFQLNVFNGKAPLGFYIFWNLLIYWLLVSIAWLIFDIAMFVPKLAHRWLDKASLE